MRVHGVAGDEQLLFDVAHVASARQEREDLRLARRQGVVRGDVAATLVKRGMAQLEQARGEQEQRALGQHRHVGHGQHEGGAQAEVRKQACGLGCAHGGLHQFHHHERAEEREVLQAEDAAEHAGRVFLLHEHDAP